MPRQTRSGVGRPTSAIQRRIYRATGLSTAMTAPARRAQTERNQANTLNRINRRNANSAPRNNYRFTPGEMNRGIPVFSRTTGEQVGAMVAH